MPDLKQALKDYVATSNSGKYSDESELNSKFPELKGYDAQSLKDYVATSNSGKYQDEETLNSKFPEFFTPKKKASSSWGSDSQPKDTATSLVSGDWTKSKTKSEKVDEKVNPAFKSKPVAKTPNYFPKVDTNGLAPGDGAQFDYDAEKAKEVSKSKRIKELETSFYASTKDNTDDAVAEQRLQDRKSNKGFWNTAEDITKGAFNTVIDAVSAASPSLIGLQGAKIDEDPLADEKKQAVLEAKKNKVTLSEIQKNARAEEIFKEKEKDNLFTDRANSYLDNLDVKDKDILEQSRADKAVHLQEENLKKYKVVSAMETVGAEKIKEYQNIEKQLLDLKEKNQAFPQELYDKYANLGTEINQISGNIEKYSDQIQKNKSDLGTAQQEYDLFYRGYGDVDNFIGNAIATTGELANGIFGAVNYFASLSPDPITRINSMRGQDVANKISGKLEEYRGVLRKPVESIESAEGFVNYASDLVANQLPVLAVTSAGVGGLAALGLSTTGQTFTKINQDVLTGKEKYSTFQMIAIPLLQGGFEVISEIPTLSILKKGSRVIAAAAKGEVDLIKKSGGELFKGYVKDFGKEFGGEHVTNIGQNFNARYVQGKEDVELLDNTGRVSKDTAFLTTLLQGSPHVFGAVAKVFQSNQDLGTLDENSRKIIEFAKQLNSEGLTDTERTVIQKQIDKATTASSKIVANTIKKIGEMPNVVYDEIISLNSQAGKIKAEAKEIQDGNLPNKKELLASLGQDYKDLQAKRSGLIDGSTTAFDLLPENEQEKRLTQASGEITKRDNPEGKKEKFEVKPEDAKKLASENYLKEIKEKENEQTPTPEAQSQAEVPQQAEGEKVAEVEKKAPVDNWEKRKFNEAIDKLQSGEYGLDVAPGDKTAMIKKGAFNNIVEIELTKEEQKEVERQFRFNADGDLSNEELRQWRKDFEKRVAERYKLENQEAQVEVPQQAEGEKVAESNNGQISNPSENAGLPETIAEIPESGQIKNQEASPVEEVVAPSVENDIVDKEGKLEGKKFTSKKGEVYDIEIFDGVNGVVDNFDDRANKDRLSLSARDKNGKQIGMAIFWKDEDGKYFANIADVKEGNRREGIATALYEYAKSTGIEIKPSKTQTEMGVEFSKKIKYSNEATPPTKEVVAPSVENDNKISEIQKNRNEELSKVAKIVTKSSSNESFAMNDLINISMSKNRQELKEFLDENGLEKTIDFINNRLRQYNDSDYGQIRKVGVKNALNYFLNGEKESTTEVENVDEINKIKAKYDELIKNEATPKPNTTADGNLPIGANNVGEVRATEQESPIQESVQKPVDGGEVKGDVEVGKKGISYTDFTEVSTDKGVELHKTIIYNGDLIGSAVSKPDKGLLPNLDKSVSDNESFYLKVPATDKYGESQEKAWSIDGEDIFDSDNGDVIVFDTEENMIEFYKKNKSEIKRRRIITWGKDYKNEYFKKQQNKSISNGKQIEPHNEVNTDVETVKKELKLSDVDNLIYDEFKNTPKTEENILKKLEKVNYNLYGKVDDIEKRLLDVEIKIEDNGIEIDQINDAENMTAAKKKKAVAEKEKEFKDLQKQQKDLEEQKSDAEQFIKDIEDKLNDWRTDVDNVAIVNNIVDKVNNRLETRKSVKEGTNLFPEDANIPEIIPEIIPAKKAEKPTTKERIAERIKLSDAKVDDWKNAVNGMDSIFGIKIKVDDIDGLNKNGIDIVDVIANIVKQAIAAGIHIDEAINKTIEHLKKTIDFDVNIDDIKERISPKKENTKAELESFRDSWRKTPESSGEFDKYDSENTQEREHGIARGKETYEVQKDLARVQVGLDAIEHAKELFGEQYVEKTIAFLDDVNLDPDQKAVAYVLLENEMDKRVKADPENVREQKLQELVQKKSKYFLNKIGKALRAGGFRVEEFRQLVKDKSTTEQLTNTLFSPAERKLKDEVEKLSIVTSEDVSKEADLQESDVDFEIKEPTVKRNQKAVKKDISDVLAQMRKDLLKVAKGNVAMSSIPYAAQLQAVTPHIVKLSKLLAELGGMKTKEIITEIHNNIKEMFPEIDKNDVSDILKEQTKKKQKPKTDTEKKADSVKEVVKQALIASGFGKEITVTKNQKDAQGNNVLDADGKVIRIKEQKQVLDWKKLAGAESSPDTIRANVEKAMADKGHTPMQIERMKKALEAEYQRLSEDVIQKGLDELLRRNTPKKPIDTKSAARKLAELANYGLLNENKGKYEKVINTILGFNELDHQAFEDLKEIANAYKTIFKAGLTELEAKTAINDLSRRQASVLLKAEYRQSTKGYKTTQLADELLGLISRFKLVGIGTLGENISSGGMARLYNNLGQMMANGYRTVANGKKTRTSTKALQKQSSKNARNLLASITTEGGNSYGDNSGFLVSSSKIENSLNEATTNKLYHAAISAYMAKPFLEGADSFNKIKIVEAKAVRAALRILEHKGYSNAEALSYVSNALTGESMKEAKVRAKELIDKINSNAGKKLLSDSKVAINVLASDMVKSNLVSGGKITNAELESIYKASVLSGGRDIGHNSNNWITTNVSKGGAAIEAQLSKAIANKDWKAAAWLTVSKTVYRNLATRFVGGGTNWYVKGTQKTLNPISFVVSGISAMDDGIKMRSAGKLDLTTDEGIKNMTEVLHREMNYRSIQATRLVGAVTAITMFAALKASGADDELWKWLERNPGLKKYFVKMVPEVVVYMLALENEEMGMYYASLLNVKTDNLDDQKKIKKALEDISESGMKGDEYKKAKAWGSVGQIVAANVFEAPAPLRTFKDAKQIYKATVKGEYDEPDYYASGLANGLLQGGIFEMHGFRPDPTFEDKKSVKGIMEERLHPKRKTTAEKREAQRTKTTNERELIEEARREGVRYIAPK